MDSLINQVFFFYYAPLPSVSLFVIHSVIFMVVLGIRTCFVDLVSTSGPIYSTLSLTFCAVDVTYFRFQKNYWYCSIASVISRLPTYSSCLLLFMPVYSTTFLSI